jgi:hypothetical protein
MHDYIPRLGHWLARHQKFIKIIQWIIIFMYAVLTVTPVSLTLPNESSTLFNHLTALAGFIFWGIWWPFVILSIIFFGRLWCGVLCPEGALSEFANQHGLKKSIPKWLRWGGWPFVAFGITTIYGQMTSVYQYPKPVLLILGGSTLAAMCIGFLYGKSTRVWCKYLCPVTGVFSLLAKLAPWRYQPMKTSWNNHEIQTINSVRCPTLLPLPKMTGAANCLMCGKCAIAKNEIQLTLRSPNEEVVKYGGIKNSFFESLLIIFGLCGIALAAFQWTNSFWFQHFRDVVDSWFLTHQLTSVFNTNVPWWVFTHYPERGDVFSWIYGCEVIAYILLMGFFIGMALTALVCLAVKITGKLTLLRFNHLTQAFIPLGGCTVFIGLLGNTTHLLRKYANIAFVEENTFKYALLVIATLWALLLSNSIIKQYTASFCRRIGSLTCMLVSSFIICYFWILILHIWTVKADSIPWNTLWL